jgi:hypothetical protein
MGGRPFVGQVFSQDNGIGMPRAFNSASESREIVTFWNLVPRAAGASFAFAEERY